MYERHRPQIYRYCLRELGSPEEAEDATQSTYLNAFRGLQRGVQPELELAWLYSIAQNVCKTRRRSAWRRSRVERPDDLETISQVVAAPLDGSAPAELMGLSEALESMPETQREAILLREWKGLSYDEIGAEMELSRSAVETLIFRARRRLASALEEVELRRLRHLADAGWLVGLAKTLISGPAATKAVVTAVAAVTVGSAAVATKPLLEREKPARKAPLVQVAPQAQAATPASGNGVPRPSAARQAGATGAEAPSVAGRKHGEGANEIKRDRGRSEQARPANQAASARGRERGEANGRGRPEKAMGKAPTSRPSSNAATHGSSAGGGRGGAAETKPRPQRTPTVKEAGAKPKQTARPRAAKPATRPRAKGGSPVEKGVASGGAEHAASGRNKDGN